MTIRVWAVALVACAGLAAQPNELTILYTGKLLGYARTPDIQRLHQWGWRVNGTPRKATKEVKEQCESGTVACQRLYDLQSGSDSSLVANALTSLIHNDTNGNGHGRLLLGFLRCENRSELRSNKSFGKVILRSLARSPVRL